jgi:tRNA(Arg) A34 adenosine deaminase TadA
MSSDKKMLAEAASIAIRLKSNDRKVDGRTFLLGAVGLRNDGVFVSSRNIAAPDCAPQHHAEARLVRKMTPGSTVWVARVRRQNGEWALAKPCPSCQRFLRSAGVERVVYTIGPREWGVIDMKGMT